MSLISSWPVIGPIVVGLKVIWKVQLAPGGTTTPPVQGSVAPGGILITVKGPVGIMEEKLMLTNWLFVTVTVCGVLSVPNATLPKLMFVGETVTGAVPVPERGITCGLPLAL